MRRLMMVSAGLMLALAGCEMSADLKVNDDGSGTFGFSFAMDEALLGQIPGGGDPLDGFREEFVDDPVPWVFDEFTEGGLHGIRASFAFSSLEDLEAKMRALDESPGTGGGLGENFRLERTATGWILEASADGPGADLGAELGGGLGGGFGEAPFDAPPGSTPGFDASSLAALIDASMRVTLPGTSLSTNATETVVNGGSTTFVWALDLSSSAPVSMQARTEVTGGGGLPMVPVGAGVVLLGLGIIAAARLRRPGAGPPEPVLEGLLPPAPSRDDELAV